MDEQNTKHPGGRPLSIDTEQLYRIAKLGCTYDEMAAIMSIDKSQLVRTPAYREVISRGQAEIKQSLRMKQLEKALKDGDTTMLIWLGKVMLGQKDVSKIEHEMTVNYEGAAKELEQLLFSYQEENKGDTLQ